METLKILKINDRDIEVRKLPLGKYADLLEALEGLPKEVTNEILGMDKDTKVEAIFAKLPFIIRHALPQFEKIIGIVSGLDEEYIKTQIGLVDAVNIIKAMFEVNDYMSLKNVFSSALKGIRQNRGVEVKPGSSPASGSI